MRGTGRMANLERKFAALKPREKNMIAAGLVAVVALLGYVVWIEPALLERAALDKQNGAQQQELAAAQAQVDALRLRTNDPDAANRAALAETQRQLQEKDGALHQFDGALVPPEKMPRLLDTLLARHQSLQLLSLKTLPVAPLLAPKKEEGKPADAKPADAAESLPGQVYRHGIEIKLAGSYGDLLAYVDELEKSRQRPLWSGMELSVTRYPRSELTLTLYTLSLDRTWLLM